MARHTTIGLFWLVGLVVQAAVAGTIGTTSIAPSSTSAGVPIVVTVSSSITDASVIPSSVNLQRVDSAGRVLSVIGTLHDDGLNGDAIAGDHIYSLTTTVFENVPGTVLLRVSAGFKGVLLRALSAPLPVNITGTPTGISISSPVNGSYLNTAPITVNGTVGDPAATITVNGVNSPPSAGRFVATVPLNEGPNTLTAVAANSNGTRSTASTVVTLDTTAPHVSIYSPRTDSVTTDASITVSGLVNDIVVGTVNPQQALVTVNGISAQVIDRTFTVANIPLALGANVIQARAVDVAGNTATASLMVTRQPLTQPTVRISAGNGQTGVIQGVLAAPLVAQLLTATGQPVATSPVVFRILSQDGKLAPVSSPASEATAIVVNTDATGLAKVNFRLGSRAGAGNNVVEASATGVTSTAVFTASAAPLAASQIVLDSGNDQSGVIGQPLPLPFIAVVTDAGHNRLAGVPVTFQVTKGGGTFGGKQTVAGISDSDGRVSAFLTLGPDAGINNNIVQANFANSPCKPVAYLASGRTPGLPANTQISGVVLDNSNLPIPGATVRLLQVNQGNLGNVPQQVATAVVTNAQGQFLMRPVPVGVFKLMIDGGTATRPGTWPTLEYDLITVSGQDNTVGMPIYLPLINPNNTVCVGPTTGGTLTFAQAPGFSLYIAPGSATFPGGSRSGCVSVSSVNLDKVPMVPSFGQQPRFVVTTQPPGTRFSPPAPMTMPNLQGLPPRTVTEMSSYDHDLAAWTAIGTATVSDDGSVIKSDPGVGVLKAGWHDQPTTPPPGDACQCGDCYQCAGDDCAPVNEMASDPANANSCCHNGSPSPKYATSGDNLIALEDEARCNPVANPSATTHFIDGCSLGIPHFPSTNIQNPTLGLLGEHSTAFGSYQGNVAASNGFPCNNHDVCYQTCYGNGSGKQACDSALGSEAAAVCATAYPALCPSIDPLFCLAYFAERGKCFSFASIYQVGVEQLGQGSYLDDQAMFCQCCGNN